MEQKLFDYKRIAEGYAKDRPYLHGKVMKKLVERLNLTENYENGLDIGCGAGLSTRALGEICNHVTGTDISEEMIQAATALQEEEKYTFRISRAEDIFENADALGEAAYDIITAAGVMNWVDETEFLPSAYKMLCEQGILLIYDFWISDKMKDNDKYTKWWKEEYLTHFPKPPRKEEKWTEEMVQPYALHIVAQEDYTLECEMDKEQFIRFMLLQSNVIAQVEKGKMDIEEVRQWFEKTVSPFWEAGIKTLYFAGYSWYIGK